MNKTTILLLMLMLALALTAQKCQPYGPMVNPETYNPNVECKLVENINIPALEWKCVPKITVSSSSGSSGCRECDCEHRKELALRSLNETGSAGTWEKYLEMDCETESNPDWEKRKAFCESMQPNMPEHCNKYFE